MIPQVLHEKVIMLHTLSVGDVMVKNVISVYAGQTVREAALVMSVRARVFNVINRSTFHD